MVAYLPKYEQKWTSIIYWRFYADAQKILSVMFLIARMLVWDFRYIPLLNYSKFSLKINNVGQLSQNHLATQHSVKRAWQKHFVRKRFFYQNISVGRRNRPSSYENCSIFCQNQYLETNCIWKTKQGAVPVQLKVLDTTVSKIIQRSRKHPMVI